MTCPFAIPATHSRLASVLLAGASVFAVSPSLAAPLNPSDFATLGALSGAAIALDSSALTVDGGAGGVLVSQGAGLPDIAVFTFDGGSILGDVTITGLNPTAILFLGAATISGEIDVSGTGRDGVSGGHAGGVGGSTSSDGDGPGGGLGGSTSASVSGIGSGSGGGFGTDGDVGGAGTTLRAGGTAYGAPLSDGLQAGSGGGGGGWGNTRRGGDGGAGGGGLEIGALTHLLFDGASIFANGGTGGTNFAGGGGGSGGGLLLHAFSIDIAATSVFTANGGAGGNAGSLSGNQGGCGGAGRIEMLHNTAGAFRTLGTIQATYGAGSAFCDQTANSFTVVSDDGIGTAPAAQVPLPAAFALYGLSVSILGGLGWRRRCAARAARPIL